MKNFQVTKDVLTGLKSCAKIATKSGATELTHAQLLNETAKALGFESYRALQASSKGEDGSDDIFLKDDSSFTLVVPQYFSGDDGADFLLQLPMDKMFVAKVAQMAKTASMIQSEIEMRVAELPARKGGSVSLQVGQSWLDFESIKCHNFDTELFTSHCPIRIEEFKEICRAVNTKQTRYIPDGFCLLQQNETNAWFVVALCNERMLSCSADLESLGLKLDNFEVLVEG